jgi:hypothetical protein
MLMIGEVNWFESTATVLSVLLQQITSARNGTSKSILTKLVSMTVRRAVGWAKVNHQ